MGDRLRYFERSRERIAESGYRILRTSPLYESEPWGGAEGGWFLNAVFELEMTGRAAQLLMSLHEVERVLNRVRGKHFGARTCDLDILLWGGEEITRPNLVVPHPAIPTRRFVLTPLCDLIPDREHPVLKHTFRDLLDHVQDSLAVRPLFG